MRATNKKMIIGYQEFQEVFEVAKKVKEELKEEFNTDIEILKVENFEIDYDFVFASYLKRNLHLVIACLNELKIPINLELFDDVPLFGRCQKIASNITIDVGHNPLAATVIAKEFENKKITLIYNSYADKDYVEVLKILKPIIKELVIIDLDDKRVVKKEELKKVIEGLSIAIKETIKIEKDEEYLVFGSFLVVEKFLSLIGFNESL